MPAHPPLVPLQLGLWVPLEPTITPWTRLGQGSVLWPAPEGCCPRLCSPVGTMLGKHWLWPSSWPCP